MGKRMYLPDVIGLTGRARHGKDSVAEILVEEYGYTRLGFADALKEMAKRVDPLLDFDPYYTLGNGEFVRGPIHLRHALKRYGSDEGAIKEAHPEYRRFLQRLGTDGVRLISQDFWVLRAWDQALSIIKQQGRVVLTDVRFPNEAGLVTTSRGPLKRELWHVDASRRLPVDESIAHASEEHAGKLGHHLVIDNNNTPDDLRTAVKRAIEGK